MSLGVFLEVSKLRDPLKIYWRTSSRIWAVTLSKISRGISADIFKSTIFSSNPSRHYSWSFSRDNLRICFRNFCNGISPEYSQIFLQEISNDISRIFYGIPSDNPPVMSVIFCAISEKISEEISKSARNFTWKSWRNPWKNFL